MTSGPRIVVVDNHDSYTFNLVASLQMAARPVNGTVDVLSNDDPALAQLGPDDLDALVISPGPGSPANPADTGHLPALLGRLTQTPVLGVCLGHQVIAHLVGADVHLIEPHHGHVSTITHDGTGVFGSLPNPLEATRYHSLAVEPAPTIRVTAWAEDGVVMGLEVLGRPWEGVQFHPESVATQYGDQMIATFVNRLGGQGQ